MARALKQLLLLWLAFCTACGTLPFPRPEDEIADYRFKLDRCPVHDELLVESVGHVSKSERVQATYSKVREQLYPCVCEDSVSYGDPALITYCPKCRAAKAKVMADSERVPDWWDFAGADEEPLGKSYQEAIDAFIVRHRRPTRIDRPTPPWHAGGSFT